MSDEMKLRLPVRPRTMLHIILLLMSNTGWRHANLTTGVDYELHCVNDFLFTVSCTLSIPPTENSTSSYWLTFMETFELTKYLCKLMKTEKDYFCSFNTPKDSNSFSDLDTYQISLCPSQNSEPEICKLLDDVYIPMINIKPNAPCCLTVSHNSSQYSFSWKSTYEAYSHLNVLNTNLHYQIHCYRTSDNVTLHYIQADSTQSIVDDESFELDTDYAARVRSSPNDAFYQGQWSDWSPEVHWTAANKDPHPKSFLIKKEISELGKKVLTLVPSCVVVILVVLFCYVPVKKLRQRVFIPNPAPYFDTLYADCHGDFKSWVVTHENTADILKAEETLQIDTLTKCGEEQEEDCPPPGPQQLVGASTYCNVSAPACDTAMPGVPYSVSSTLVPTGPPYCQPGSAAGDSGCCHCNDTSPENDNLWYCNEYCTLSAFQRSRCVTAEHHVGL